MSEAPGDIQIKKEDLLLESSFEGVLKGLVGSSLGFLGALIISVALGLTSQTLFGVPIAFLGFVLLVSSLLATVGALRNRILKGLAKRGLAWTYWSQRLFSGMFWFAVISAIYGILSIKQIIPMYSIQLSELFAGLYFLLATPQFLFGRMMEELRESRLCLLEFMSSWNAGKPIRSTGHSWLRRGMRGIEQRLKAFGIPAPTGELFFGSSYSLFKGHVSNATFEALAAWLIEPSNYSNVNWTIPFLLHEARKAEEDGFHKRRRFRLRNMTLSEIESAIIIVVSAGPAIYALLVHFGIL